jgi:hypothetical protein
MATVEGADFELLMNGCSEPIPPGVFCQIAVAFRPQAVGSKTGSLSASGAGTGTGYVALAGRAFEGGHLSIAPDTATFSSPPQGGSSAPMAFTVTNVSSSNIDSLQVSVSRPSFRLADDGCAGRVLPPGYTCSVLVVFAPQTPVLVWDTLAVTDNRQAAAVAKLVGPPPP